MEKCPLCQKVWESLCNNLDFPTLDYIMREYARKLYALNLVVETTWEEPQKNQIVKVKLSGP